MAEKETLEVSYLGREVDLAFMPSFIEPLHSAPSGFKFLKASAYCWLVALWSSPSPVLLGGLLLTAQFPLGGTSGGQGCSD